ncbi:MAG TPA: hypothetical protein VIG72_10060 [Pontibacter sp.]
MTELTEFLTKLNNSDLLVLTNSADRIYCRFFRNGLYTDRMYVTDKSLQSELLSLIGEGEEIDATGIAKLRQLYLAV